MNIIKFTLCMAFASLLSCGNDSSFEVSQAQQPQMITVYDQGSLTGQGASTENTLANSVKALQAIGADIAFSGCAQLTNIIFNEADGALSGVFFIHEIQIRNPALLDRSNFKPVTQIGANDYPGGNIVDANKKVGYTPSECASDC